MRHRLRIPIPNRYRFLQDLSYNVNFSVVSMPEGNDNTPAAATGGSEAQDDNPGPTDPGTLTGNVTPPNLGNELNHQQIVERRSASWASLSGSMHDTSTSSLAVNTPECQVPGLSSFSHAELNVIRMVLGHISYLAHVLYAVLRYEQPSKLQSLSDGVRQAIAMKTVCAVDNAPCRPLEPSESYASMLSAMGYGDADSNIVLHPCFEKWTTASGLARDLLCPAYMATYCWIGHKFCPKLLSFPFSFAVDDSTFSSVWFACPVMPDGNMFATLKEDANTRRAAVDVNSPGAAIMKIVGEIEPQLLMVVRSVHDWCLSKNLAVKVASRGYQGICLLQLVKSEAVQYRDCTTAISGQVQSALPSKSSLPTTIINYNDDRSSSWFRTAEYIFNSIKMPVIDRSTASRAQLNWHRYTSDVLHARQNCSTLSERQVIQHLSQGIDRNSGLFSVSQDAKSRSDITVATWLDVVRDYHFTSGQFRLHVENAWTQYDILDAIDFNDLIHHIRTYWQLIFLDYVALHGKLSKLEFACRLFGKLQDLRQKGQHRLLGRVAFTYMSASELVKWWRSKLYPMQREHESVSDPIGEAFVNWVLSELMEARESANAVQRFVSQSAVSLDFASPGYDSKPRVSFSLQPTSPYTYPRSPRTPRTPRHVSPAPGTPRAAAVSVLDDKPDSKPIMQKRSHYRSYVKLRGLKDSIKKPEIPFLKWYGEIKHTQGLSQVFINRCDQEEREDSDSLTAALKHAIVPPDFGTSRSDVIKQMFIVHILWEDKNCPLCARRNPPHMCTFKTCKWLRDNLPDQIYRPLVTARGDQQIVPLTTGQEVASPAPSHKKRGRPGYDSSTSRNPVSPRSPGNNSKRQKSPFREHIC